MHVLVSLHDVTPAHQARIERAEALLASVGVSRVAYLLVPDFHRRHPILGDQAFATWCRRVRPFAVDWVLHGCYHVEDAAAARTGGAVARLSRWALTSGEAEFLELGPAEQVDRLAIGSIAAAATLGIVPTAFVAPAWLFNRALLPALEAFDFLHTEDHLDVIDVRRGVRYACPVIPWATCTVFRRVGARVVCPALHAAWRHKPRLRIALHPHDFDHVETIDQIRRLLSATLERRTCAGYADVCSIERGGTTTRDRMASSQAV